jgi:thiol:disulfide interchange protein
MRTRFTSLIPMLAGVAVMAGALSASPARAGAPNLAEAWNAPAIAWHTLATGIPKATRTGKTVMMVFHAPWCTACAKFRSVFKDERVVAASRGVVMILVDADADKTANGAFAPDGTYVPRTLFLSPAGEVRTDLVGKTDPQHPHTVDIENPDELLALMRQAGATKPDGTVPHPDQRAEQ